MQVQSNPRNRQVEQAQTAAILGWLKSGQLITQDQAKERFGCYRLASRIHKIRQEHEIRTTFCPVGNGQMVASYSYVRALTQLERETLARRKNRKH